MTLNDKSIPYPNKFKPPQFHRLKVHNLNAKVPWKSCLLLGVNYKFMDVPEDVSIGYWAVKKLGFSARELSKKLDVSQTSVGILVKRGERIAQSETSMKS